MQLALMAAAVGVVVGYATGGRLRHVGERPVRLWPLLVAGAVLQLAAPNGVVLVAGLMGVLGFCVANLQLVGMGVVTIGLALNVVVIAANGAMPVRPEALAKAHLSVDDVGGKRRLEEPGDRLTILGDVLPARPLRQVLSFGDLIIAAGTADVVVHLMRRRRRGAHDPQGNDSARGGRFLRLWTTMAKRSPRPSGDPEADGETTPGSSVVSSGATSVLSRPAVPAGGRGGRSRVSAPGS
jgi:hypothetical protein